jgi:hypothetical protein
MQFALPKTIELSVPVHKAIGLIQIHTLDANNMNAWQILNAQLHLHVKMRNVLIPANVQEMLTVQQGTTEEYAPVSLDLQETHMV